jgi:hypothetical protein
MELRSTASTRVLLAFLAAIFAMQVYRAAARPIGVREAYLYDRFVRPTARQVWESELPNRDVLYSLLEKRSVGLFHVSPFAVRLPSVLFGALYLWAVWSLARRWSPALLLAIVPVFWDGFSQAEGTGVALALCLCVVELAWDRRHLNWIGICLGLSISAKMTFAIPAGVLALAILLVQRRWEQWCNTVLIPASAIAVIVLVLPVSHAHAPLPLQPELNEEQAKHIQAVLDSLRSTAGRDSIRIAATPDNEPIVNFYRAEHRATNWERASLDDPSKRFDYYLFSTADASALEQRHLIVVYRDGDFVLARPAPASM